jgi:hypothetical protein
MKNLFFFLVGIFFCFSCAYKKGNERKMESVDTMEHKDSEIQLKKHNLIFVKDATIIFSVEGLSAEGSEVKARYIDGIIINATWNIYGETGQSVITYKFEKDGAIKASEKKYTYKTDLNGVNSDKDIHLKTSIEYSLDSNGIVHSKIRNENSSNIFKEFKKNIPMTLSDLSKL